MPVPNFFLHILLSEITYLSLSLSIIPHCPKSSGRDESEASSQANALPAGLLFQRFKEENDNNKD